MGRKANMHINIQPEINVNIKLSDQEIEVMQYAAEQEEKAISEMLAAKGQPLNKKCSTIFGSIEQLGNL
jgi:hypothetical protein